MAKIRNSQQTDEENGGKGDPNATGSGQAKAVRDDRAGMMTSSDDMMRSTSFPTAFGSNNNGMAGTKDAD